MLINDWLPEWSPSLRRKHIWGLCLEGGHGVHCWRVGQCFGQADLSWSASVWFKKRSYHFNPPCSVKASRLTF